jgi:hypothetical protein
LAVLMEAVVELLLPVVFPEAAAVLAVLALAV